MGECLSRLCKPGKNNQKKKDTSDLESGKGGIDTTKQKEEAI